MPNNKFPNYIFYNFKAETKDNQMKMSPPYIPLKNFLERLESSLLHRSKNII